MSAAAYAQVHLERMAALEPRGRVSGVHYALVQQLRSGANAAAAQAYVAPRLTDVSAVADALQDPAILNDFIAITGP